jgi:tetratricopeptide (TPR) repeat protein
MLTVVWFGTEDLRRRAGEPSFRRGVRPLIEDGAQLAEVPDLRGYLRSLGHDELVELLLRYAQREPAVYRELALRVAGEVSGTGPDAAALRHRLDASLRTGGFIGYGASLDYAREADSMLDVLDELFAAGHVATVAPLARRAVDRIAAAMEQIDDSSGAVGDACQRALTLSADACAQAPPNPGELGEWLLDHALGTRGWPDVQLPAFAGALGADGVAYVRERVERLWADRPAGRDNGAAWMREHGLWRLREELAAIDSDVDARVAVLAEQLPRADISQRIARLLWEADRVDEALRHARQGLAEGSGWQTGPLADFLAGAYLQLGRGDEALALRWQRFEAAPTWQTYLGLRAVATELGRWEQVHEDALRSYRAAAAAVPGVADELVRTLLDESDVDGAWQVVREYECSPSTRIAAAQRRGQTHPADAVPFYQEAAEQRIEHKNPGSYRSAAQLLRDLRNLHGRTGDTAEFQRYLGGLRERHRRKTRLLAELNQAGLR